MILDIPGVSERRQTPRYEIKLDIDPVLDNGSILTVTSQNISSCGLQIICDSLVTDEIDSAACPNEIPTSTKPRDTR